MPTTAPLIVLSSGTAWVDPTVQVHAVGCAHVERRLNDPEWSTVRCDGMAHARGVAAAVARRIGASNETYMDCSL